MTPSSAAFRLLPTLVLALAVASCAVNPQALVAPDAANAPLQAQGPVAPLTGQAVFPDASDRQVLATAADVKASATVSLIDAGTNATLVSGVSDAAGTFSLSFQTGFVPVAAKVYYLEAVKGLGNAQPGRNAARVRTLVQYVGGAWVSLSGGTVVVDVNTTAIAIGGALKNAASAVDMTTLIGKYTVSGSTFNASGQSFLSSSDYASLQALVAPLLTSNQDPVANVGLVGSAFRLVSAPQLNGMSTAVLKAGQMLTLAGHFPPGSSARFPVTGGYASVPLLGSGGHTQIEVPAGVVAGSVSLVTTGVTTGALAYTVPSFTLGLSAFHSGASGQPKLTVADWGQVAKAIGSYVYLFGGANSGTTVQRARVNADGSLGQFAAATDGGGNPVTLQFPHSSGSVAVIGDYVYMMGGDATVGNYKIERAAIAADGTVGQFAALSSTFPAGVYPSQQGCAVIGRYIYLFGGRGNGVTGQTTVIRALVGADGSLGNFQSAGVTMTTARCITTALVNGGFVYLIGGSNGGNLSSIERAAIQSDGTLGAFAAYGTLASGALSGHTQEVVGNDVYLLGGNKAGDTTQVLKARMNADGSLGAFAAPTDAGAAPITLRGLRRSHASAIVGNRVYAFGGYTDGIGVLSDVECASINGSGNLTSQASSAYTVDRGHHNTLVAGNNLYMIGGATGASLATPLATVKRAVIGTDGSLGALGDYSHPTLGSVVLNTPRAGATSARYGKFLYVAGGWNTTTAGAYNTIERATIGEDGSLSPFTQLPAAANMTSQRHTAVSAVVGNYLYVIGGMNASGVTLASVERALIDPATGDLGTFQLLADATCGLRVTRDAAASVVLGKYVYVLGGYDQSGGRRNSVERAEILASGELGNFSILPGVTHHVGLLRHNVAVVGNKLYAAGGWDPNYYPQIQAANILADGTLGAFATVATMQSTRKDFTMIPLGNKLHLVGGTWNDGSGTGDGIPGVPNNTDETFSLN